MRRVDLLSSAAFASLAGAVPRSAAAAGGETALRFLTVRSESGADPIFAARNHAFAAAGLDIDLRMLTSGGVVLSAVVGGAADVGISNPVSLAAAYQRGLPITCIAPTVLYLRSHPTSLLMVENDSNVRSAADLNGQTIAVNGLKNTPQFATEAWIDQNGGDSKTVSFLEIPFSAMAVALKQGRVAAAFFAEPEMSEVRPQLRVLGDPYGAVAPRFVTGAFFTTRAYAQRSPDTVQRVQRVLRETAVWANAHQTETANILAEVQKLDVARVEQSARSIYAEQLEASDLQPPIDLAARYGLLPRPVPAEELIWRG